MKKKTHEIFFTIGLNSVLWCLFFGVFFLIINHLLSICNYYFNKMSVTEFSFLLAIILSYYLCWLIYPKIKVINSFSDIRENLKKFYGREFLDKVDQSDNNDKKSEQNGIYYNPDKVKFTYEKLLQLRDVDNKLMWTRINLLLVFQGVLLAAIAAGIEKLFDPKFFLLFLTLLIFGLFSSLILYALAKGGSWWVDHWEMDLAKIEYAVIGDLNIFWDHKSNKRHLIKKWKKDGYISVRNSIVFFTSLFPLIWTIIILISVAIGFK
jgi:hypothetical protein